MSNEAVESRTEDHVHESANGSSSGSTSNGTQEVGIDNSQQAAPDIAPDANADSTHDSSNSNDSTISNNNNNNNNNSNDQNSNNINDQNSNAGQQRPQRLPGRVPIRINVRNRSGRPMPTPRIHVDRNGNMHLNIGQMMQVPLQRPPNAANGAAGTASAMGGRPSNNNNNHSNNHNNTMSHAGRRTQLQPLTPQPVHDSSSPSPLDDDQYSKYKCVICMELLNRPVGCGNCASRFCHSCLSRYVLESQRNQAIQSNSNNNGNNGNGSNGMPPVKCPACRVGMTAGLVPDKELEEDMKTCGPVPCRFEGCSAQLSLSEITQHEVMCQYAPVRCRFAPFGCTWKGQRGQVKEHEASGCHYAKVSGLVHQFRLLQASNSARIDAIEQQTALNLRLEAARQQNLQRTQRLCKTNIFALLEYCHLITCNASHVMFANDRWAPYFITEEGRALVTNFAALIPLAILFASTSLGGFRDILRLVEQSEQNVPDKAYLIADSVLSLCVGLLGVLMFAANFSDVRSSKTWHKFQLGNWLGTAPLIGDVMALSSFTILESAFEVLYVGLFKCILLWWLLTLCTAFYPVVVLTLSESLPRSQRQIPLSARHVLSRTRAMEPLLFGLRYSLLGYLFGPIPCLDAAMAINLLPAGPRTSLFRMRNSFLGGLPKSTYAAYLGAQLAILLGTNYGQWRDAAFNSVLAMIFLPLINCLDHKLFALAIRTGRAIYDQSFAAVQGRPHGPERDYNVLGVTVFGSWVCTLLMIAQF